MVDTRFPVSVHLMTSLAYSYPNLVNSEQLAVSIKTNPSFIRKLIVSLVSAGLVESVRGKMGGVRLAQSAKSITLDQIYRAVIESNLIAVPNKTPNKSCEVSCGMRAVLCKLSQEIEENTLKQLSKKTLSEVLNQVNQV